MNIEWCDCGTFRISKYPVTNEQYMEFVEATEHPDPDHWEDYTIPEGKENHPVTWVSYHDAVAFCEWAGVRLPTKGQWMWAAIGNRNGQMYPWGNDDPTFDLCNFDLNERDTTPVFAYPLGVSLFGVMDMAGNVWEWCAREEDGILAPLHGGSFRCGKNVVRCRFEDTCSPDLKFDDYGFRLVSPGS